MAHTEDDIRKGARLLLEKYGCLTTSEIIVHMSEVITFDDEDLTPSKKRPGEPMIYQIIRNPVGRKSGKVKIYLEEGVCIDKTSNETLWYPTTGVGKKIKSISKKKAEKRRVKLSQPTKVHEYRKINWDGVNERKTAIGKAGESFVFELELSRVKKFDSESISKVIHLSEKQGDGFGYDILSLNEKGEPIYIEVKTTKEKSDAPFYMSINELNFFKENKKNNAFIYRVYNFNEEDNHGEIKIIPASKLFSEYKFDPISFMVIKK